jgi:hypothetical protein
MICEQSTIHLSAGRVLKRGMPMASLHLRGNWPADSNRVVTVSAQQHILSSDIRYRRCQWSQSDWRTCAKARGAAKKKMTKVTYICRSAKKKVVTYFILFLFLFLFLSIFF